MQSAWTEINLILGRHGNETLMRALSPKKECHLEVEIKERADEVSPLSAPRGPLFARLPFFSPPGRW
jgi:hypothetical protein